jgi:hypothetical protein
MGNTAVMPDLPVNTRQPITLTPDGTPDPNVPPPAPSTADLPAIGVDRRTGMPSVVGYPGGGAHSRFDLTRRAEAAPAAPDVSISPYGPGPVSPTGSTPGYLQASTDPLTGQPTAMNPSLTKLGKLLTVLRAAGVGGIVGSTQPTFGTGFEAAQANTNQQINENLQQQQSRIGVEQARQNLQYLPLMKTLAAQQMRAKMNLEGAQAERASSAASRWGAPKVSGTRLISFNPDTNKYEDVGPAGTGKPATKEMGDRTMQYDTASDSWKDVGPAKAGTATPYGKIPPEVFGMLGAMPTDSKYDGKDYGTQQAAQAAWGRDAMAIKDNEAKSKASGYATTRGQVVTDTETGITAPVPWSVLGSAAPGKYVSPQYDPNTRLAVKSWQDLAPSGKVGQQVTSYNTFLRHTGDLYDAIDSLQNSGFPDWNKNLNWLRTHTGDPRVKTFLAKLDPVQKEFQSFLLNNRALYSEDRDAAKNIIDENSSPQQMKDALQSIIHTGGARLSETNDTFKRATGSDIPDLISPEAQASLLKVGGPQAVAQVPPQVPRQARITGGGGGGPTQPTPQTHLFDSAAWAAANPGKDVNAAIAKAKKLGYQVR